MTRDESLIIAGMVANNWPGTQWNDDTLDAYAQAIEGLDYNAARASVAAAVKQLEYYPRVAVLREFYNIERAKIRAREEKPVEPSVKKEKVPLWVRRWVAARYLHAMFGKDQDLRSFPEQQQWANPYVEPMPPTAWLDEAEHVTDERVWRTLQG